MLNTELSKTIVTTFCHIRCFVFLYILLAILWYVWNLCICFLFVTYRSKTRTRNKALSRCIWNVCDCGLLPAGRKDWRYRCTMCSRGKRYCSSFEKSTKDWWTPDKAWQLPIYFFLFRKTETQSVKRLSSRSRKTNVNGRTHAHLTTSRRCKYGKVGYPRKVMSGFSEEEVHAKRKKLARNEMRIKGGKGCTSPCTHPSNNGWEEKSADVSSIEYHLFSATDIDKFERLRGGCQSLLCN